MTQKRFASVAVEGGLLHRELLDRVIGDDSLPHRDGASYGLAPHESVRQAASRAYEYLRGTWTSFTAARDAAIREGRPLAGLTRDRWLLVLLRELGYGLVPTAPTGGLTVDGTAFKVSHVWEHVPIHLLGWGVDLDHRTKGVRGAADAAPQSMVQDLLNRSDDHLWAIVSNGAKLRLLRDSRSLVSSAYVEFDLEEIFANEQFSDFVLLYRLAHASRFQVEPEAAPATCLLEKWRDTAIKQGERALEDLRVGVQAAIETLATGFAQHPANDALRSRLAGGTLTKDDYRRAVLRIVYRMLFWFVAEERDVLLAPNTTRAARDRYEAYFSSRRLRDRARAASADRHDDLWDAVTLVFTALGEDRGLPALGIPGIGGLFERIPDDGGSRPDALDEPLEGARLHNGALLTAVRHLAYKQADRRRVGIDFARLGSEELGSVYESLLDLHPDYDPADRTFTLKAAAGSERKTTGSYYTPTSLTEALLDSALDPVLDEAVASADTAEAKVEALLRVTVCDPACGSGHFLVAAARRIARRIAQLRSGEDEPSPALILAAMREAVSRCIHGVDVNEMAAELAKVSLWLESVEPGKPLAFLDANVRVGNALLGATPELIKGGIPREAFKPIEGDDKVVARAVAKENEKQQAGQGDLFAAHALDLSNTALASSTRRLVTRLPERLSDVNVQRRRLRDIDAKRLADKRRADAWCAAFVQELTEETRTTAITGETLDWIADGPGDPTQRTITDRVEKLAADYRFFHWHVEFPHIFTVPADDADVNEATGWHGGFTCVIGNPPWDHVELHEKEFFAPRREEIAQASTGAERKKLIAGLAESEDPADRNLHAEYSAALRHVNGVAHLIRESGRYPLTARGRINTYAVFAEDDRTLIAPRGRLGVIVPTGIATDATTQYFFRDLVETAGLASLFDFENAQGIFPTVHRSYKFSLLTVTGRSVRTQVANFAFFLHDPAELADDEKRFQLTPEEIKLLNPNTGTCPVFRSRRDAEITLGIYHRVPVLVREGDPNGNPWGVSFMQGLFNMTSDSALFHTRDELEADGWHLDGNVFTRGDDRMLPLYEAKMIHHFNHRWATYESADDIRNVTEEERRDPSFSVMPRYWVADRDVNRSLDNRQRVSWFLGWRDVCRSTDERTTIVTSFPAVAVGNNLPLALCSDGENVIACLQANLGSFAVDYVARLKAGGLHLNFFIFRQVPVISPTYYDRDAAWSEAPLADWISCRVLELSYNANDMSSFASDLGDDGAPFIWDEERRFTMRAELDAAYFHLYGVERDDVDYILDTFPIVKRKDEQRFGEYRTKRVILEIYDAMAEAARTGVPYQTILDPPPGHGPRHPARDRAEAV